MFYKKMTQARYFFIVAILQGCGSGQINLPKNSDAGQSLESEGRSEVFVSKNDDRWLEDLMTKEESSNPEMTEDSTSRIVEDVGMTLKDQGKFDLSGLSPDALTDLLKNLQSFQEAKPEVQEATQTAIAESLPDSENEQESPIDKKEVKEKAIVIPEGQPAASITLNANGVLRVLTATPTTHIMGMKMKAVDGVSRFILDRGVYSGWKFEGSKGKDVLVFGGQGVIISKRVGGVVDFGVDSVTDRFVFKNQIDVAKCSEKHGFQCHPLNHLQQVVIKNFGPEDKVILQGTTFTAADLRGDAFPGVPVTRLKIERIPTK